MKRFYLIIALLLPLAAHAQYTPKDVMEKVKVQEVPFDDTKISETIFGSGIEVEEGELSRKIYSNAQLTEWDDMRKYSDQVYYCLFQIDNPSHSNNYMLISLNDAGDFWTCILASVSPGGNITDWINAKVTGTIFLRRDAKITFHEAPIMQYRIAANGDVIISRIVPTSTTSIPLGDLKDFHGYRQDTTYRLDPNGKFQIAGVVKYTPLLYTAQMLSDCDYHVWNGNETPAEQ